MHKPFSGDSGTLPHYALGLGYQRRRIRCCQLAIQLVQDPATLGPTLQSSMTVVLICTPILVLSSGWGTPLSCS